MQIKTALKWSLSIVSDIVVIWFFVPLLFLVFAFSINEIYDIPTITPIVKQTSKQTVSVPSPSLQQFPKNITSGLPVRLKISKIKVDAPVKYVGINAIGAMDLSKGLDEVSWYNLGPRPGEQGSAVIAWHYWIWKNGTVSVFQNLNTLRNGDEISLEDDKGTTIFFIVREIKLYKKDADASAVFISNDGMSHLNFITCVWDNVSKTYAQRLVVFTDRQIN